MSEIKITFGFVTIPAFKDFPSTLLTLIVVKGYANYFAIKALPKPIIILGFMPVVVTASKKMSMLEFVTV